MYKQKRGCYELVFLDTRDKDKFNKFVSFVDLEVNHCTINDYIDWYERTYNCLLIGIQEYYSRNRQLKIKKIDTSKLKRTAQ